MDAAKNEILKEQKEKIKILEEEKERSSKLHRTADNRHLIEEINSNQKVSLQ